MLKRNVLQRNVVMFTIAFVVLGVGAYAWAQGEPERPTTTTEAPAADGARSERRLGRPQRVHQRRQQGAGVAGRAGRAIHGDLIVRGRDGFENVTFDRGEVTSHSATSITLERADGVEVTKAISGDTAFRGIASADEIGDGELALVVSKGETAVAVAQRSGDPPARPR